MLFHSAHDRRRGRSQAAILAWVVCIASLLEVEVVAQTPVYTDAPDVCITCSNPAIFQAEPSVCVDPVQLNRILVTANTWNAPDYSGGARVAPCFSGDGGATWQCQGTPVIDFSQGDPASVVTTGGRFYALTIADNLPLGSRDQGLGVSTTGVPGSWSAAAFPGIAPPEAQLDKGHLWADNSLALPRLFAAWTKDEPAEPILIRLRYADDVPPLS